MIDYWNKLLPGDSITFSRDNGNETLSGTVKEIHFSYVHNSYYARVDLPGPLYEVGGFTDQWELLSANRGDEKIC